MEHFSGHKTRMKAQQNSVVGITYDLREKGQPDIVDQATSEQPFYFILGLGQLLPKFEAHIDGLSAGETFEFFLDPEDAYGISDPEAVIDIPIDVFMVDGKLQEEMIQQGRIVHMQDQEGNPLSGLVVSRGLEHVKVDFNHPMAGRALHFTGAILEVREASSEELMHRHVHGAHGHQH